MRWWALPLLLALVLPASGLRLTGQLYELGAEANLQPVGEAVVVEAFDGSNLAGRTVASRGAYTLELGPGDYRIVARSPDGDVRASENITLRADGRLDLILLPELDLPELELGKELLENLTLPPVPRAEAPPWPWVAAGAGSVLAMVGVLLLLRRRSRAPAGKPSADGLPDDLRAMVRVLREEGGRTTQKELRRRLSYSEAKVSLMVADLENRGLVRKFKVGRGNVVVLESAGEAAVPDEKEASSPPKENQGS